ncbi:MAG: cyclic 2,3-diphosphoglycerate synthase [Candidatus Wallbacteria bacterium]|nr:cyclic 2,3-diphosphoglycerate synthase [Candidatus Wallbacteria bacterium]
MAKKREKVIIMGAAGRDFHNFNTYFRDNEEYEVVAFTATQIPDIEGRVYPKQLAGKLYPKGIPIQPEEKLVELIKKHNADQVVFSYSDVTHEYVMHRASIVTAAGADFRILGPMHTMIQSKKPVISICAIRTGCGKSQTTRAVCQYFLDRGKKVVAIRHPMPYGDLNAQRCQRFASLKDLDKHKCTIEEREEYEPHIMRGVVVYAGVDYEDIIRSAEKEADVIIWDGGNNDFSFYKADMEIVVVDPHRPGHELKYYPGETNFRRADVIVINKIDSADSLNIELVRNHIMEINPKAVVIDAASPIFVEHYEKVKGKRVLVIEDGPTLTHGEMKYGAGIIAARKFGAAEIVDPRPFTVGSITDTFKKYPGIGTLLPAMGYGSKQIKDLEATINKVKCDLVISATPIDITRLVKVNKPMLTVTYELEEIGFPKLKDVLCKVKVK